VIKKVGIKSVPERYADGSLCAGFPVKIATTTNNFNILKNDLYLSIPDTVFMLNGSSPWTAPYVSLPVDSLSSITLPSQHNATRGNACQ